MARLIPKLKQYLRVASLDEVTRILQENRQETLFLAGGTSLAFRRPSVTTVVDMSDLPFKGCRRMSGGETVIGALTTIRELEMTDIAACFAGGILRQTCDRLAATPLRNMITAGGNLCAGFPWSDLPVALMVLDAELVWQGDSVRTVPVTADGVLYSEKIGRSHRVLTEIRLPSHRENAMAAFIKFARTTFDYALVSTAVSFHRDGSNIRDVRIAVGGLTGRPMRLTSVEQALEGRSFSEKRFSAAARAAANIVPLRPDTRAGEAYRRDVMVTLIERAFGRAMKG